jgi:phytoene/squalene synthetase
MDLYEELSYKISKDLTSKYSTSFGISSKLFSKEIRKHIYAVYGMARISDEVVDTYKGKKQKEILNDLENDIYRALDLGYSANPIIHAFAITSREFGIDKSLIRPFFKSMLMDINPPTFSKALYDEYIYGSAEVIGLMCLKVFCQNDNSEYEKLSKGARKLGSAYQKVNFLRDLADDYKELGRIYFPGTSFEEFDEKAKNRILNEIEKEFVEAEKAMKKLPKNSRLAVMTSYSIYFKLLEKLKKTPALKLKEQRVRVNNFVKFYLILKTIVRYKFS